MRKVALITGASKGIGKAIALKLAEIGYDLMLTGRNQNQLLQTKQDVEKFKVKCAILAADLVESGAPSRIIKEIIHVFGQIDVVVNNAGHANAMPIKETSIELEV